MDKQNGIHSSNRLCSDKQGDSIDRRAWEVAQGLKCPLSNHEDSSSNPPEPMKMSGGHGGLEARDRIPEQAG